MDQERLKAENESLRNALKALHEYVGQQRQQTDYWRTLSEDYRYTILIRFLLCATIVAGLFFVLGAVIF